MLILRKKVFLQTLASVKIMKAILSYFCKNQEEFSLYQEILKILEQF